jgi:hypothetical protein
MFGIEVFYVCMVMPDVVIRMYKILLSDISVGRHFEFNFGNAGKPSGGLRSVAI